MRGHSPASAEKMTSEDAPRKARVRSASDARQVRGTHHAPASFRFTLSDLGRLRRFVSAAATGAALQDTRREDLVLAIDELATNSICHGGGSGNLDIWRERDQLVCEVSDGGLIEESFHGREMPDPDAVSGRGLWLVEQLTDKVEVRSAPESGSFVRVSMQLA